MSHKFYDLYMQCWLNVNNYIDYNNMKFSCACTEMKQLKENQNTVTHHLPAS